MTRCIILCTPCIFIELLSKNCSNNKHCIMISTSCGSFLCSDVPWIIIFDVDVCLGARCLAVHTSLYQMAALVLSSLSLVFLYKLTIVACWRSTSFTLFFTPCIFIKLLYKNCSNNTHNNSSIVGTVFVQWHCVVCYKFINVSVESTVSIFGVGE